MTQTSLLPDLAVNGSDHPFPSEDVVFSDDFPSGLKLVTLAERLGVTKGRLSQVWNKRRSQFIEWSREKDPDGLAWSKPAGQEKSTSPFYPLKKNPSSL